MIYKSLDWVRPPPPPWTKFPTFTENLFLGLPLWPDLIFFTFECVHFWCPNAFTSESLRNGICAIIHWNVRSGKIKYCIVWYLLDRPLNLNLNTYNGESLVTRSGQPLSSWASHFEKGTQDVFRRKWDWNHLRGSFFTLILIRFDAPSSCIFWQQSSHAFTIPTSSKDDNKFALFSVTRRSRSDVSESVSEWVSPSL